MKCLTFSLMFPVNCHLVTSPSSGYEKKFRISVPFHDASEAKHSIAFEAHYRSLEIPQSGILFSQIMYKSNFRLNGESDPGWLCFCFTSFCDWSRKLAPLSKPIRIKLTKTNHDVVTRVFPRVRQFSCF